MAQYEHLPIYKKAFDITLYSENIVRGFSRYHKYTLGTDLRDLSREVVRLIVRANSERDRLSTLYRLRDTIEELKVTIRVCKDVMAFKNLACFIKDEKWLTLFGIKSLRIKSKTNKTCPERSRRIRSLGVSLLFSAWKV